MRFRYLALAWLAAAALLPPVAAAGDAALERGRRIVAGRCFLCHGMEGESATELSPRLAGQNAAYIAKQLANFQSGERKSSAMRPMVADLATDDLRAVALYYSRQRAAPHPVTDPGLVARGKSIYEKGGEATEVAACIGCHGERGHGSDALPRLAGQIPAYIAMQLRQFGTRARTNDNAVMHTIAARMVPGEIDAVAAYLATLD